MNAHAIQVELWQAIVVPTLAVVITLVTALLARGVNREGNAIVFSRDLMGRLEKLEQKTDRQGRRIFTLERVLEGSLQHSDNLAAWGAAGGRAPKPEPPRVLQEFLEAEQQHRLDAERAEQDSSTP